ncbi:hypothetical protein DK26_14925 [Bosea sp. WAO]|uniref:hypothetical protein n=1 Tax=Bosea sp. WAO TaxID=406341 RepID=UPI000747690D|nr:hypothetical protein [Bosea sp. WAO]KUL94307.1 hypothetical protein DK26_14925 [Bosea sp. WAO]
MTGNQAYESAKLHRAHWDKLVADASARLKAVPGVGSGPHGLTPDEVKRRPDYQQARAEYQRLFSASRNWNRHFVAVFGAEIRAERRARA